VDRWEQRWADNVRRYENMECLTLVTPWSSAMWRFCTSELKVGPICSTLKSLFPGKTILNCVGIRGQESTGRAKQPVSKPMSNLEVKTKGTHGISWHPILNYDIQDVWDSHEEHGFPRHPAYDIGSERLSCSLCVLATQRDHLAAMRCEENHPAMHRITALEIESTFSFQPTRWISDTCYDYISTKEVMKLPLAKEAAATRRELEAKIPKDLRMIKGVPTKLPTISEAYTIASTRDTISKITNLSCRYTTGDSVLQRYKDLMAKA